MPLSHFPRFIPSQASLSSAASLSTHSSLLLRRTCPRGTRIAAVRTGGQITQRFPSSTSNSRSKDQLMDREALNPRATENSRSDDAAAQDEAFDPKKKTEDEGLKDEHGTDPLGMSGANKEASKGRDPQEGGTQNAPEENRERASGAGSGKKNGGGSYGG